MQQFYAMGAAREVTEGNYCHFVQGAIHADRIMEEHDFVYIVSGEWSIWQEDKEYRLQADDVLLLRAGLRHFGLTPCAAGTVTMYLHSCPAAGDNSRDTDGVDLPTVIHCRHTTRVKELFSDILFARASGGYGTPWRVSALFDLLLLELHRAAYTEDGREDELVAEVVRYFQRHPSRQVSLDSLSRRFYVNARTLDRRFQRVYGKSVYRYQHDLKLEAAKRYMLDYPQAPLREVARNHGFYDEFHLSRAFKKAYGLSPAVYRRRGAEKEE